MLNCSPSQSFISILKSASEVVATKMTGTFSCSNQLNCRVISGERRFFSFQSSTKFIQTTSQVTIPSAASVKSDKMPLNYLRDKKIVPASDPPSPEDVKQLYQFFDQSRKIVVLTGAGVSTESGIPDYRSPSGAYSSGFRPITHQVI